MFSVRNNIQKAGRTKQAKPSLKKTVKIKNIYINDEVSYFLQELKKVFPNLSESFSLFHNRLPIE